MKTVQSIRLSSDSGREILEELSPAFPCLSSRVVLDRYMPSVPWHWHQAAELFYIRSGSLVYETPGGSRTFPAGSGGLVLPGVLHTTRLPGASSAKDSPPCTQLLYLFDTVLLAGEHGSLIETKYILPLCTESGPELLSLSPEHPEEAAVLGDIRSTFDLPEEGWGWEPRLREALMRIWLSFLSLSGSADSPGQGSFAVRTPAGPGELIRSMLIWIHGHYGEDISVDRLSAAVHISRRTCFRLFRENLHMTPSAYLQSYRLEKARCLLAKTPQSVTEIAADCGFGSSSWFGKLFRKTYGMTPVEYRKLWHDRAN